MNPRIPWTPSTDALISEGWTSGLPVPRICIRLSEALGRTPAQESVRMRIKALGLPPRKDTRAAYVMAGPRRTMARDVERAKPTRARKVPVRVEPGRDRESAFHAAVALIDQHEDLGGVELLEVAKASGLTGIFPPHHWDKALPIVCVAIGRVRCMRYGVTVAAYTQEPAA